MRLSRTRLPGDAASAMRRSAAWIGGVLVVALGSATVWLVIRAARSERHDPARCPAGLVAQGPRCCAPGQALRGGSCEGAPSACPPGMSLESFPAAGCAVPTGRARIEGGTLRLSPSDWEAEGQVSPRTFAVQSFALDATEVTIARWRACVATGRCRALPELEPGLPVRDVSAAEAERFCQAEGGRLPTRDEWLFAAAGSAGRRYPWGQTGLVCRRATFGLEEGPCATGASDPELAGARPDGRSPEGVYDLAGNVAEWAREPDGSYRAHGGSFRSRLAGELKSWAEEGLPSADRAPHVGFRCAYELSK